MVHHCCTAPPPRHLLLFYFFVFQPHHIQYYLGNSEIALHFTTASSDDHDPPGADSKQQFVQAAIVVVDILFPISHFQHDDKRLTTFRSASLSGASFPSCIHIRVPLGRRIVRRAMFRDTYVVVAAPLGRSRLTGVIAMLGSPRALWGPCGGAPVKGRQLA
jgi:hypothetical protein